MRQDIVLYETQFADHINIKKFCPEMTKKLRFGAIRLLKQMSVLEPAKNRCLDDLE